MNPTHREPRGTAGYTERHVFLSSSRSPHAPFHSLALPLPPRPSSPFASLSLFFEFVKLFGVAITENLFLFFLENLGWMEMDEESLPVFWEIWIRRKSDSIFVAFSIRTIRESIYFGYNLGIDRVFEFGFSEGIFWNLKYFVSSR